MLGEILIGTVVSKVVDSFIKADAAERIYDKACDEYVYTYRAYLREQKRTTQAINNLTQLQLMASEDEIARFVTSFRKIKEIDLQEVAFGDSRLAEQIEPDVRLMEIAVGSVITFVKDNLFLGLALAGVPFVLRAEKAMNDALTAQNLSRAAICKLEDEMEEIQLTLSVSKKLHRYLRTILRICRDPLKEMENITDRKQKWCEYTVAEKQVVSTTLKLMQLIKTLIAARVVTEEGRPNPDMNQLLQSEELQKLLESN